MTAACAICILLGSLPFYPLTHEPCIMKVFVANLLVFSLLILTCSSEECKVGNCFPDFASKTEQFDICKTNLCFLVLPEPPFVLRNAVLEKEPALPIPCNNPKLEGIFFGMLKSMPSLTRDNPLIPDGKCIYAGSKCSFDGSLCFMKEVQLKNSDHLFIAGGPIGTRTYNVNISYVHEKQDT